MPKKNLSQSALGPPYHVIPVSDSPESLPELGAAARSCFCLVAEGRVQRTPGGRPLAHASRSLMEAIREEAERTGQLSLEFPGLHSMLCTLIDYIEPGRNRLGPCLKLVLSDPTLSLCAGPELVEQCALLEPVHRYLKRHELLLLNFPQSTDPDSKLEWLSMAGVERSRLDAFVAHFDQQLESLGGARQCVVTYALHAHNVFLPGVLLALGDCTIDEYVDAYIAVHCLIAGVFADTSRRQEQRARAQVTADATVMTRFRDLAEAR